jgi:choline dehydrogenase-like flavoprotein
VLDPAASLPPLGKAETLGHHHMCTTRMSAHPRHGVVDADCRVHDVENLYLGGSSVFATGGHSNPTYTIVQLALRLGDYLNSRLG